VLLQRIFTLVFGRAWWTYALALAWAISVVYLAPVEWFAGGLLSIPALTATLASIHGYLCWRASGRRAWLAWSLVAMGIGLGFYIKALLIPFYLILMRVLLRDSLRSLRGEWRVWLAYAAVCAIYLLAYSLGDYGRPASGATVGEVLRYLRIFWFEGLWPMVFGIRVPSVGQEDWHRIAIVAAQVALIGLVAWSVARRRSAWRAWAFLLVAGVVNALTVVGRVSEWGADVIGFAVRYYTEPALLVVLAIPFAFATPRLHARVAAVEVAASSTAPAWWSRRRRPAAARSGFRLPTARVGAATLLALGVYMSVAWGTADTYSNRAPTGADDALSTESQSGRFARAYFDNLRADLAHARRSGVQPSLLDHDVPEAVMTPLTNLAGFGNSVRFSLLSSVLPLFDEPVTFNRPGPLYIVEPDGHLRRTRFVRAASWSSSGLWHAEPPRIQRLRVERSRSERCVVAVGSGAGLGLSRVEWEPRPDLRGRDWWLRARYRTDPAEPFSVQTNSGAGWVNEGPKLPPMGSTGTALVALSELPTGEPTNAGVRLLVPPFGRLCLHSLEIGSFKPPAPPPTAGGEAESFSQ
jgi:hypothetical protein